MKIKYLNLYDSFDEIWTHDKAKISAKLDATKAAKFNRGRTYKFNIAFLIVYALSCVAFIVKSPDPITIIGNAMLMLMLLTILVTSKISYKDAVEEVDFYTRVLQAYDNDVLLSIVTQAVELAGSRYGITIANSPAVFTRLIKNNIAARNIVVDRGCRKIFLEIEDSKITIPVSDVKNCELNCITILQDGIFVSNQDNVNMSNIKETVPVDLDVIVTESSVEDIVEGRVPTV